MKVTIKTIKDGTFSVEMEASATVGELKAEVQKEKGNNYAPDTTKVIYQGKVLDDDSQSLESTSYKESAFFVVMPGKKPKKPAAATTPAPAQSAPAESSAAATAPATATPASSSMETAQDTPAQATSGDSSSESNLPRELPANSPLAFLANNPNFVRLRAMAQQQPEMLPSMMQQIAAANPELVQLINDNQEDFYILINSEDDGDFGGAAGGMPGAGGMQVSPEDQAAIERLAALGFDPTLAAQAYFACEKNENLAANWLFENGADMMG